MNVTQVLTGHDSEATSYLVADYPYSFKLRCRIRYWLERHARLGYRFVSQTENPKTLRWNQPKRGTYHLVAARMYLDERGHVQYAPVNEYTDAARSLEWAQHFAATETDPAVSGWFAAKVRYTRAMVEGKAHWRINGVVQPTSEADLERYAVELRQWEEVLGLFPRSETLPDSLTSPVLPTHTPAVDQSAAESAT